MIDYKNRRERLFNKCGLDTIVVPANKQQQFSLDQAYPFEQERNFFYLTGLNAPGLILVITKNHHLLIKESVSETKLLFDGGHDDSEIRLSQVDDIAERKTLGSIFKQHVSNKRVGVIKNTPQKTLNYISNPIYSITRSTIKKYSPKQIKPVNKQLAELRSIKDSHEIKLIEEACSITYKVLNEFESRIDQFSYENEIEGFITHRFKQNNANHAYQPIISSGRNSQTIHYVKNNSKLSKSSLLIDVGARLKNYNADITRTYNLSSNKLINQTVDLLKEVQDQSIGMLKPGVRFVDVYKNAFKLIAQGTKKLGLGDGSKESTAKLFPYSLGHFLGLDVHDVGDYKQPLQKNMVLTVEPGIHSEEFGFGARVEDDVLITDKGAKILGKL